MEKTQHRELPISSYEVIHLPTHNSKSTVIKVYEDRDSIPPPYWLNILRRFTFEIIKGVPDSAGIGERQQGAKRQKVMPAVTSQADESRSKLSPKCPSFTKTLAKSHVGGAFWMGLPRSFCRMYLPLVDTHFILEYENGKRYAVKYLADRTAFSGRWREFSLAEKLAEGDTLEFQLVGPTKFKVHRLHRADDSGLSEVDGVCATPNLDAGVAQSGSNDKDLEKNKKTYQLSSSEAVSRNKDLERISYEVEDDEIVQNVENVEKSIPEFSSGDSEHLQFPTIVGDCNGIANFDDFIILLDELLKKDYNLPQHIKWSYHQLCSSQRSILHASLLKDSNPILVTGCIIETVDIVNAMKSCELSTFDENFTIWDRKLKSLEALGMDVRFLSARLLHLLAIFRNSEIAKNKQQYMDLCSERADSEIMIKKLQEKLTELRRLSEKRADNIEKLGKEIKEHELWFQEQVSAPW